jgi:hypothetical protein
VLSCLIVFGSWNSDFEVLRILFYSSPLTGEDKGEGAGVSITPHPNLLAQGEKEQFEVEPIFDPRNYLFEFHEPIWTAMDGATFTWHRDLMTTLQVVLFSD